MRVYKQFLRFDSFDIIFINYFLLLSIVTYKSFYVILLFIDRISNTVLAFSIYSVVSFRDISSHFPPFIILLEFQK